MKRSNTHKGRKLGGNLLNDRNPPVPTRRHVLGLVLLIYAICFGSPALSQQRRPSQPPSEQKKEKRDAGELVGKGFKQTAKQLSGELEEGGRKVGTFAAYMNSKFESLSDRPAIQWAILAGTLLGGLAFWLLGWALLRTFFVPVVVFAGCATGGFIGSLVPSAFAIDTSGNLAVSITMLGFVVGGAFYFLVGKKFKPLGMFLVVFAPFVLLFSLLLGYSYWIAIIVLGLGAGFGFASMVYLRPVSILATSFLGTFSLLISFKLFSGISGLESIGAAFRWLTLHPTMLFLAVIVGILLGTHTQYHTGPGDIEVKEVQGLNR